jgi:hypothetical protein
LDGLADVVFWGRDEAQIADEFGGIRFDQPGDNVIGWRDLPVPEAYAKAVALNERHAAEPDRRFAFDFRPHSHHWQVMAAVRASDHQAGTIEVGGARIMFAMTSVGDGWFPVHIDHSADGSIVALRITVQRPSDDDEEDDRGAPGESA